MTESSPHHFAIYVEALLGAGHMRKVATLSKELSDRGHKITILCSSNSLKKATNFDFGENTSWHALPELHFDKTQGIYVSPRSIALENDHAYTQERANSIIGFLQDQQPDTLITEPWPLGKGIYDNEMKMALDHIQNNTYRPALIALSRDLLLYPNDRQHTRSDAEFDKAGIDIINRYYDALITAGDETIFTLKDSIRGNHKIEIPIYYPGYFLSPLPDRNSLDDQERDVVVSAGGGFSENNHLPLLEYAIRARQFSDYKHHTWRIFISEDCPPHLMQQLESLRRQQADPDGIIFEKNSGEYMHHLVNAKAIISMAGLNSVVEAAYLKKNHNIPIALYALHDPALPISGQEMRAQKFGDIFGLSMIRKDDTLTPENINQHLRAFKPASHSRIELNGAKRSADILEHISSHKRARNVEHAHTTHKPYIPIIANPFDFP